MKFHRILCGTVFAACLSVASVDASALEMSEGGFGHSYSPGGVDAIGGAPIVFAEAIYRSIDIPDVFYIDEYYWRAHPLFARDSANVNTKALNVRKSVYRPCFVKAIQDAGLDPNGWYDEEKRREDKKLSDAYLRAVNVPVRQCAISIAKAAEQALRSNAPFYIPYKETSAVKFSLGARSFLAISGSSSGTLDRGRGVMGNSWGSRAPIKAGFGRGASLLVGEEWSDSSTDKFQVFINGQHADRNISDSIPNMRRDVAGVIIGNPEAIGISWKEGFLTSKTLALKARIKSYVTTLYSDYTKTESYVDLDVDKLVIFDRYSGKVDVEVPLDSPNVVYSWRYRKPGGFYFTKHASDIIAYELAGRVILFYDEELRRSKEFKVLKAHGIVDEYGSMSVEDFITLQSENLTVEQLINRLNQKKES